MHPDDADEAMPPASGVRIPPSLVVRLHFVKLAYMAPGAIVEMFRARKRTFVDELGWDLPSGMAALEVDAFDLESTLYCHVSDGDATRYSVRLLPRDESMVASIWPLALPKVPPGALEFSRFVVHSASSPRWNRASTSLFKASLRLAGHRDLFGIADERMVRVYRTILDIPPESAEPVPATDGLFLCKWRL